MTTQPAEALAPLPIRVPRCRLLDRYLNRCSNERLTEDSPLCARHLAEATRVFVQIANRVDLASFPGVIGAGSAPVTDCSAPGYTGPCTHACQQTTP